MKKRILFVEDDAVQLEMYAMLFDGEVDEWEVTIARNGPDALKLMERSPFHVVVSDWLMPDMDGDALMLQVKKRYPQSSRIILSVLGDEEKVARALADTHQFIAKPFDIKVFKETLRRVCTLDTYLQQEKLRTLVGRIGKLPSFPSLYSEVMKEMASPNSSIESVSAIVMQDPAMTAKMLQIANSAVYGLAHRVTSPFEAVEYLGLGTVRSLVLSAHIFSCFEEKKLSAEFIDRLWKHAIQTGRLSQLIMELERASRTDCEEGYVAGMLHDVGKLILADALPGQYQKALALSAERQIPVHAAELEEFGATHADVAAYLLGLWGLPAPIVEAVAFHHKPGAVEKRAFGPLTAVHVANVLEYQLSGERESELLEMDGEYLGSIGLADRPATWRGRASDLLHAPTERKEA